MQDLQVFFIRIFYFLKKTNKIEFGIQFLLAKDDSDLNDIHFWAVEVLQLELVTKKGVVNLIQMLLRLSDI